MGLGTNVGKTLLAICVFGLVTQHYANAALISVTDPFFGKNSLTEDTNTGLLWLDVTKSTSISAQSMRAKLASSSDPFGQFRYASYSEVRTFWQDAGIPKIGSSFSAANNSPVKNLLKNYVGLTSSGGETRGLTSNTVTNPPGWVYQPKLTIGGFVDKTPGHGGPPIGTSGTARADLNWVESPSLAASYLGHWLVRRGPVKTGPPEFRFPLQSSNNVYLNTEAGGRSYDGVGDTYHTGGGYYSLDFDVNSGKAQVVTASKGKLVYVDETPHEGAGPLVIVDHGNGYFSEYREFTALSIAECGHSGVSACPTAEFAAGTVIGTLDAVVGDHLHFQIKYDTTVGSIGRNPGKSAKSIDELRQVRVAGRLMEDYKLPNPCILNPNCQAVIYGKGLPLLPAGRDDRGGNVFEVAAGSLGVGVNDFIYIDPLIAIGYDFEVTSGPLFASVLLPDIGDGLFELFLYDTVLDDFTFDRLLMARDEYNFAPGGVNAFRILGIETSAFLDPEDPTAFVTGLRFTEAGLVKLTQIPISVYVPEPATLALLSLGLAGLGFSRRKQ